jgi:hypothetical protein
MTTTCSRVAVIQRFLSFIKIQTTSEDRINASMVKSIAKDDIMTCLITNMTSFITGQCRLESLSLEIYNDISVPNIIGIDKEK